MKNFLILIIILQSFMVLGQSKSFSLSGEVKAKMDKKPIESATIHLERIKDSTVVSYTISDEKGKFNLKGKTFYKRLRMVVSFVGMKAYQKIIPLEQLGDFKVGEVLLEEENLLDAVIIKSRAPITIKKDTLEFNVKSFKTKKNANIEDLLKKLPGVEVDDQGKITINGKPVKNLLVNGKPFFGDDPTIATRNLSKEIVEKVQITDSKTDSEAFTGEKGDGKSKTINLTIKKENNRGWFGRVAGGVGTNKRYEGAMIVNRFNNGSQYSALASGNNLNSPGFSIGEIQKMIGSYSSMSINSSGGFSLGGLSFGMGQGLISSKNAGFNFAEQLKKGTDLSGNYFYSGALSINKEKRLRDYTLPDREYFTDSNSSSENESKNHKVQLDFKTKIDSTLFIKIKPSFGFNDATRKSESSRISLDDERTKTNEFNKESLIFDNVKSFNNRLSISKKINGGSSIRLSITNGIKNSTREQKNKSSIAFFGDTNTEELRDQSVDVKNKKNDLGASINYRYPLLNKKVFLTTGYRFNMNKRNKQKNTYDFNSTTQDFSGFNKALSINNQLKEIKQQPYANVVFGIKKFNFNLKFGYEKSTLKINDELRPELSLDRKFGNLTYEANFYGMLKSKAYFNLSYSVNNELPSITQIQNFKDISNQSNIVIGNSDLKQKQKHQFYFSLSKFDWQKGTGFRSSLQGNYNQNDIIRATSIDEKLIRTTTYKNTGGTYYFGNYNTFDKKIKLDSLNTVKVILRFVLSTNKNKEIINDNLQNSIVNSASPGLGFEYNWNKILMIKPVYRISFKNSKFDINTSQNRNFVSHNFKLATQLDLFKKLEWKNDARYMYNPNIVGFNKSSWFWNSTFSYSVLDDKGAITLKCYDVLNQNTNATRTASQNYIEDKESSVLQQYFLLGFSWKFNTLGAKGKTKKQNFIIID